MKKLLLLSMSLLFMGVNMRAQSISAEQMDERFNDGTNMPFGWFAEGWSVKDGHATSKSQSSFGGFGGGGTGTGTGTGTGMGDFDMSSLFGSNKSYYLLTPPVNVTPGDELVFSAKKPGKDDSGMGGGGGSMDMGAFFVVEKSVYGSNKWLKIQDFYSELNDSAFQTFKVSANDSGEYRYRFRTSTGIEIDSVAGFHIDNQAPDLYVTVDSISTDFVNWGIQKGDSTKSFYVINTGTGPLKVRISSSNDWLFKISNREFNIEAGDSAKLDVTFVYSEGQIGWNEALLTFSATDKRLSVQKIGVSAIITKPGVWVEDFNNPKKELPYGWFTEGWEITDSTAAVKSGDFMGASPGSYLLTPPLDVQAKEDVLVFSVKKGSSGFDMSAMMDMFMGSSTKASILTVEKTVYGSNYWEKVHEFTDSIDKNYTTLAVTGFEPGQYRFRFKSSSSVAIDSVAGYKFIDNAPDLYITIDSVNTPRYSFGMVKANTTKTFMVINTGTGTLEVNVASSDPSIFSVSQGQLTIASGDSATLDVNFIYDEFLLGEKTADIVFTPYDDRIKPQTISVKAYSTYVEAWEEDFELDPEYVGDDEKPQPLPEGWETTGWELRKGGAGGMASMMGGGNESWQPQVAETEYDLITPRLQAKKGDMLYFEVSMKSSGGLMGMFMGGGGNNIVLAYYNLEGTDEWVKFGEYTKDDAVIFMAPVSGIYRLKFTGREVTLDNFMGFRTPLQDIYLYDGQDNSAVLAQYDGQQVNVHYDRVLSAVPNADGSWTSKAFTLCLPYDFNFSEYYSSDQVRIYRLVYVDFYNKNFIFTNDFNYASAGCAWMVVVDEGSVRLNAVNVTIQANSCETRGQNVRDYKDFTAINPEGTTVGQWKGTFQKIYDYEAEPLNLYGMQNDGRWLPYTVSPDHGRGWSWIGNFRAYFQPDASQGNMGRRTFKPMFMLSIAGDETEEVEEFPAVVFDEEFFTEEYATEINHVIPDTDADEKTEHRYYDLQGRRLHDKPAKGLYIDNGKKIFISK